MTRESALVKGEPKVERHPEAVCVPEEVGRGGEGSRAGPDGRRGACMQLGKKGKVEERRDMQLPICF